MSDKIIGGVNFAKIYLRSFALPIIIILVISLIALGIGLAIGFGSNSWPTSLRWEVGISGGVSFLFLIFTGLIVKSIFYD